MVQYISGGWFCRNWSGWFCSDLRTVVHIFVWMVLHRSLNGFATRKDLAITNLRMVLQKSVKSVHGLLAVFLFRMLSLLPSSKQTKWSIWNATIAISSVFLQMVLRSIYQNKFFLLNKVHRKRVTSLFWNIILQFVLFMCLITILVANILYIPICGQNSINIDSKL